MGRRLTTYVHIGGEVYGPGSDVPGEVAELITNPDVWADDKPDDPATDTGADKPATPKRRTAAKKD
jgi:hypothetical protein